MSETGSFSTDCRCPRRVRFTPHRDRIGGPLKRRSGPTTEVLSTAKVYCDFDCVGPLVRQSGFRETLTNPFDILLSEGLSAEMFFE